MAAHGGGSGLSGSELELPVLPLRDSVLFPSATVPFTIARPRSNRLLDSLPEGDSSRTVALVAQRDPATEDPRVADLHTVATLARILNVVRVRNQQGHVVFATGLHRLRLVRETQRDPFLKAHFALMPDLVPAREDPEYVALRDSLRQLFVAVVELAPNMSNDLVSSIADIDDAGVLTDFVSATLPGLSTPVRQQLLSETDVRARMRRLTEELMKEKENLELQQKIQSDIREKVAGAQREFFLREQLKAIHKELGDADEESGGLDDLRRRVEESGMPEEAQKAALRELGRLGQMQPAAAEYTVSHTYLDWLVSLPWRHSTARDVDIKLAEKILDEDHYDLERVKERIVEYLAVVQLKRDLRGPILCFVGPPGVGKTSLGKSIARALGRAFVRISLGGMHDEAEIRGHRRTYVGALPGQIIQGIRRAGTTDPVFMLDEVDKLGRDFRGDPASALLEVLDPEQNFSFRDHYLEVPLDLSKVLFVTTANVLDTIPPALLDRMEVLELPGYTEEEKIDIARRHLIPKQVREHGLDPEMHIRFTDAGIREIIRHYTHEAGVRNLEREIGALCRKHARRVAGNGVVRLLVTPDVAREHLGAPRYLVETELEERTRMPGVAVALAWTPHGGDVLYVEAARMPRDRGELTITGQVGQVMQESTRAALSWLRANAQRYGIDPDSFKTGDVHIHVPSGAVPKDGPSAGVVMAAALVSAFTCRRVRPFVAMTGEITLSGQVLPVGGIKEKVLAAKRSGVREVVLPEMNRPHVLQDIPPHLREGMTFHFVRTIDEALEPVLGWPAERASADGGSALHHPPGL